MKTIRISQVSKMKSADLIKIIDLWHKYDPRIVLIANAELRKRKFKITYSIEKKQNEFSAKYNHSDIDEFINRYLKINNHNNYQEFFQSGIEGVNHPREKQYTENSIDNKFFTFINPYLSFIDNGHFYRNPFSWLYGSLAIINLILPLYVFYQALDNGIFNSPSKFVIASLFVWLIVAFASWISFQIWWDRKSRVISVSNKGDEFVATPVFSHLIQTLGEWLGTWIGIVGSLTALLTTLILGSEGDYLSGQLGLGFMKAGFVQIILMPVYGFLVIVSSRFLAEQFRALSSIANNTGNKELS
ncbi:hypothetical protein L0P88_11915 [Muricauda sp. SCSIO 64092]|uniref:hypothetical protein n=1 Tax=Allomuricauda sp. SCSIO 64092 TaxID=2908842 RepID=UPI001FF0E0E7|nr:hypothetical protein [Muricauda sp. SCSIO 64092]UOY09218.1 hypothetical protein L0P88_11915 [Muricauda sp. SCSIO 64092]